MKYSSFFALLSLLWLVPADGVFAEAASVERPPASPSISATQRKEVIEALAKQLQDNYVFPDVAKTLIKALRTKNAEGDYAQADNVEKFAEVLSQDMRALGHDGHFQVQFDPEFAAHHPDEAAQQPDLDQQSGPSKEEIDQTRQVVAERGFGLQRLERLPGNIGYLEVRGFPPTDFVGAAYSSAISLLSGSEALILDLRRNGGGQPNSVAQLLSHFFAEGDERHLNDIYWRPDNSTRQFWTVPGVGVRYTKPIYVLTSERTFSGGEECAYDLQTQKRATLIGETTGGGANPGDMFPLVHGLLAFVPTGRSINPITKTNWEHVGVKPDIAVPAEKALQTAHAVALKVLLQDSKDPEQRNYLQELLTQVENDALPKPSYKLRH